MAQRRLLNRSLGGSEKYYNLIALAGSLLDFAHALFPLLVSNCDDHGRQPGDAFGVAKRVYPVSPHSIDEFERVLELLHAVHLIYLYVAAGRRYLYVINFRREQPGMKWVAKPTCPEPNEEARREIEQIERLAGTDQNRPGPTRTDHYGDVNVMLNPPCPPSGGSPQGKPARRRRTKAKTPPPEQFVITDALKEWASKRTPTLSAVRLEVETERFLNDCRKKGVEWADWTAAWKNWMLKAVEFDRIDSGRNQANPDAQVGLGPKEIVRKHGGPQCDECHGSGLLIFATDGKGQQYRRPWELFASQVMSGWKDYREEPCTCAAGQTNKSAHAGADPQTAVLHGGER